MKLYHCVEFWAVRIIVLKIFHSFLNLRNTSQILVQPAGGPREKTTESLCPQHKHQHQRWTDVSPFSDDPVCVFGHVVITDDVIHAGQGLVHVFLQTLQVLCLFVYRDDGVFQLHQTALEGRQDRNLRTEQQGSEVGEGYCGNESR